MKVLLPFLLGSTYVAEEMPGHIHSKTQKKETKLKAENGNVAATGDSAGIKGGRT